MKLNFEITQQIPIQGSKFNVVQFWDNQVQIFYLKDKKLYTQVGKLEGYEWESIQLLGERQLLTNEQSITDLSIDGFYGDMVIGTYTSGDAQKMFIYEYGTYL